MLAKEAARSKNIHYVFDSIPKSTLQYKAEEEAKKNGKPSSQRPTKQQPLENNFLQSRTD
jgi:hypothetical protein